MTGAFHTNLTALSLLALLVGMFLIYNTMTFMVMQRRPLLGRLRALGATRRQLGGIIAMEASLIGMAATAAGLVFGIALAHGLLQVVNRTIVEIYDLLTDSDLNLSNLSLLKGVLLGMGGTLLAAIPAALEATRVTPRQALLRSHLEASSRRLVAPAALAGVVALGSGFVVIRLSSTGIGMGFSGIFIIIMGVALLIPFVTVVLMACLKPLLGAGFGISGRYACQSVTASLSRTTAAIAALMIAIATVIGIGLMVNNFRLSVDRWLQQALRADMYVSLPSTGTTASGLALDAGFADAILALPQVTAVSSVRRINIESSRGQTELAAYGLNELAREGFRFIQGEADEIWPAFQQEDTVIVSEPYAWRHGLKQDDVLELRTDNGSRPFRVLGVYKDYGSDQGVVSLSRRTYERHWRDDRYSGFGIYTLPGTNLEVLRRQVQELAPERELWLQDRNRILQTSLEVFDNTFVVTDILRVLAAVIAFHRRVQRTHGITTGTQPGTRPAEGHGLSARTGAAVDYFRNRPAGPCCRSDCNPGGLSHHGPADPGNQPALLRLEHGIAVQRGYRAAGHGPWACSGPACRHLPRLEDIPCATCRGPEKGVTRDLSVPADTTSRLGTDFKSVPFHLDHPRSPGTSRLH